MIDTGEYMYSVLQCFREASISVLIWPSAVESVTCAIHLVWLNHPCGTKLYVSESFQAGFLRIYIHRGERDFSGGFVQMNRKSFSFLSIGLQTFSDPFIIIIVFCHNIHVYTIQANFFYEGYKSYPVS